MPKGVKTLEKELHETMEILKHHEYHRRVGDLRKLPSKTDLEARITKLEKALEKAKSKSGGTRRRRGTRKTRSTRALTARRR